MKTVLKIKVHEFLFHKIENIGKICTFEGEKEFLKYAVEDTVRRCEILKLDTRMDEFAERITKKRPGSITEAVLKAMLEGGS